MSGKYTRKRCLYSKDSLHEALCAINAGMNVHAASKKFNIPRSTLDAKKKKVYADKKPGIPTVLSNEEENTLIDWIFYLSRRGFPVTKNQLLDSVQMLIKSLQRKTKFVNDRPGRHWYEGFLKRHKKFATRMTKNLTFRRAEVTENAIRGWFSEISNYLNSKELLNIAPERIFNCDEAAFLLNPKESSVLAEKGQKNVYKIVDNNEKENITVLFTGNAAGILVPPLVLFSYKRIPGYIASKLPNDWSCGRSDNGWMTGANFYEYIANVFHPWLIRSGIPRPVILYLDGHSSHMTKHLSDFCSTHEIELIAFYPNATHILQPMDVSVFRPIKLIWKTIVNKYRIENKQSAVAKEDFGVLLNKAIDSADIFKCLQNGFRVCGLYPLNADAIDYSKIIRNQNRSTQEVSVDEAHQDGKTNIVLDFMRENLDKNIIDEFEKNRDIDKWQGIIEYTKLFEFWKMCVKKQYAMKSQTENLDNRVMKGLLDPSIYVQNTTQATVEESINISNDFSNILIPTEDISTLQESIPLIEVHLRVGRRPRQTPN